MKTRKQAAIELYGIQKSMEARPYSFNTVYRRIFKNRLGNWQFIGSAYDYTA